MKPAWFHVKKLPHVSQRALANSSPVPSYTTNSESQPGNARKPFTGARFCLPPVIGSRKWLLSADTSDTTQSSGHQSSLCGADFCVSDNDPPVSTARGKASLLADRQNLCRSS